MKTMKNTNEEIIAKAKGKSIKAYHHFIPLFIESLDTYAYSQFNDTKEDEMKWVMKDFRIFLNDAIRNTPAGAMRFVFNL